MSYASVADLLQRYDFRDIGGLVSDDNREASPVDLATVGTPGNSIAQACLDDASGDIEAALFSSGRYTELDLTSLTGNSLSYLKRITCDIAMALIYARRPLYDPDKYKMAMETAESHLERLRKGENVFNLQPQIDAGTPDIDGPSTMDFQNLNLIRDRVRNFFPGRRLPNNR